MRTRNRDSRPFRASISIRANRVLFIALIVQLIAAGCDLTSPDKKNRGLNSPDDASLTVSPASITATAVSWSEIDLTWATSPSASGYQVFRSTTGAAGTYTQIAQLGPNASSYPNTGLTGSTQYCYEVRSFKNAGKNITYGAFSSAVCATTSPPPVAAPSATDAAPYGGPFRIRWQDNSANEDGFRVEQASSATGPWSQVTSVGANVTTAYVYAQYFEQPACFRVIAFNTVGPSNPSTPDCTALPATPLILSATPLDQQSITITWADNSSVEDGYRISRQPEGGSWTVLATVGAGVQSYRDATATPDVTYNYHVEALKDGGFGFASYDARAMLATTAPAAPTGANATFFDDYYTGWIGFAIAWTDASSNETGFRVEYSADGQSGWSTFVETGPGVTYFSDANYVPNSGYFRVIAFNDIGPSSPSNTAYAEYGVGTTDLVATAFDQRSIDLTWTDNAKSESGYEILRSTSIDGTYEWVTDLPADSKSYHDDANGAGLASGQEYWYLVLTMYDNCSACWGYSNYASATTLGGLSPPAAGAGMRTSPIVRPAPTHPIRIKGRPTLAPRRTPGRSR